MNILAIDTASDACSIALAKGDEIEEQFVVAPREHAKRILNDIETLLSRHAIKLSDLDVIAFGRGPGSFTGVRIATSVAQALAYAHDIPVAAVSNLEALALRAYRMSGIKHVLPAFDARMQEIYWALFEYDESQSRMLPTIEEQVSEPSAIRAVKHDTLCGIGSAWESYHDSMTSLLTPETIFETELPHAQDIAQIARLMAQSNQLIRAEQATPIYLRDNVAHKKKA